MKADIQQKLNAFQNVLAKINEATAHICVQLNGVLEREKTAVQQVDAAKAELEAAVIVCEALMSRIDRLEERLNQLEGR